MLIETKDVAEVLPTEADSLARILTWSAECPDWQRDALRRLSSQDKLTPTDIDELLAICKGAAEGSPLEAEHIRDPAASHAVVTLSALYGLENVNALAVGERLTFGKTGLTVIYGDNGAGKSGYARVLKQICRARSPKNDTILPNIYNTNTGAPKGNIDFHVGYQKRSASWIQGGAVDAMLSAVSVFDSRTANVHVDSTNDLAYTPLSLEILASLAQACQDLKAKLNAEIQVLKSQTPAVITDPECRLGTAVGKLIASLSATTKLEQVNNLADLKAEEETRLEALQADLGRDPAQVARQLQATQGRLNTAIGRLQALAAAITDERATALREAAQCFAKARAAALAASVDLFAAEPLPDIGSDVWKELWEAARAYSRVSAYPELPFPVTSIGARCVLCHQELDEPTAKRLSSFEAFIRDESKRREDVAREAYSRAQDNLTGARLSMVDMLAILAMVRDELGMVSLADDLRRAILVAAWRLRTILRTREQAAPPALPRSPELPIKELQSAVQDLVNRATALLTETDSPERVALIAERDELADRKWLGVVKDDVLAQIQRLQSIGMLAKAGKDTTTNRITTLSDEIARVLVTKRLRSCFATEVDKLGVAGLAIELHHAKTNVGVPFFQIRLINKPSEPVGKVLSEGEHRCVALSAFLAELATVDAQSAIVFDDPVTSLDHLNRDKVAARLAEEGRHRQVIVFTHDMAFLLLLDEACRATRDHDATPIAYRLISRGESATGFCHQDPPASVMPLDKVIEGMRNHLTNVKIHYARGDQAKWLREVTSFQDQLRTTWERAVEEVVCPVIKRLARKVDTVGLLKLTVLTADDCTTMRDAFGRCSMLLHSQPGELNPALPAPSAIEAEIEALARWIASIRERQASVA